MSRTVDSETISSITEKEKEITGDPSPAKGGPTAQAQKHVGENLSGSVISDITKGEKEITGGERVKGGPTAAAQSTLTKANQSTQSSTNQASGVMTGDTVSSVTNAEKGITGQEDPVEGGPTAQAQKHTGEPINSQVLHDITEGEKKITDNAPVKGGPTAAAQSELGKSHNQ